MASPFSKFLFLAFFLQSCMCSFAAEVPMSIRHQEWMKKYGRVYKDEAEKLARFKIFKENVEYIEKFNQVGRHKYKLGITQFTDLSNEEFRAAHNGLILEKSNITNAGRAFRYADEKNVPATMDWRAQGAVTRVKDQGRCGCCWAFTSVAAIEGIIKIASGNLISLSEQQLLDCSHNPYGCRGGSLNRAYDYVISNGGISTEENYPYVADVDTCNHRPSAVKISSYESVPANSESSLLQAVANQPVSVAIDGSHYDFQHYKSGIFTGPCGTNLTHGVAVIGYGTDIDGTEYWLVKNSWRETWGENGYARILRNVGAVEGLCGIAMAPIYPVA